MLGRGFHILIKNASFSSPPDVRSHNPPPLGPSVLAGTCSLLQSMWDTPQSTPFEAQHTCWHTASCPPPSRLSLLAGISLGVWLRYHLQQSKPTASRYCPLWAFPFGLPFKIFKTHLLGRDFHTLIKNASLFSPTDVIDAII